jgi:hypothetical protein
VNAVLGIRCTWCMLYLVYAVLGVCCTLCMLYSVYAVLVVCCTRWLLYSGPATLGDCCTQFLLYLAYAVLSVNSWSLNARIERDDWSSCSDMMVEWRIRKREMRGDGVNHHGKLGMRNISCANQCIISVMADTSSDLPCNVTDIMSSQPKPSICSPDFSSLLVSSTSF